MAALDVWIAAIASAVRPERGPGARSRRAITHQQMNDAELIEEYRRAGDPVLFGSLVEHYQQRVFRLAVSILGPGGEAEAEEITQEVFLRVYRRLHTFRMESGFASWLYRIAFNCALDAKKHRRPAGGGLVASPETDPLAALPSRTPGPLQCAMSRERERAVETALAELPAMYQAVIRMHYWLGASVDEIAEYLGAKPGTVKSYLFRARARLHAKLVGAGFQPAIP